MGPGEGLWGQGRLRSKIYNEAVKPWKQRFSLSQRKPWWGWGGGSRETQEKQREYTSGQQVECAWGGKGRICPRSPESQFQPQKDESHRYRWGIPDGHSPQVAKILRDGKVTAAPAFPCREAVTPNFPTVSRSVSKYPAARGGLDGGRASRPAPAWVSFPPSSAATWPLFPRPRFFRPFPKSTSLLAGDTGCHSFRRPPLPVESALWVSLAFPSHPPEHFSSVSFPGAFKCSRRGMSAAQMERST